MAKVPDLKKWLIPQLRKISKFWPEKHEVLNEAKVKVQIGVYKNGNPEYKTLIKCNGCKELFERNEIDIDHINPVISTTGFEDWDTYITQLFCPSSGLQILCKKCHLSKSTFEAGERKKSRILKNKLKNS
jgi:hypothetical protein